MMITFRITGEASELETEAADEHAFSQQASHAGGMVGVQYHTSTCKNGIHGRRVLASWLCQDKPKKTSSKICLADGGRHQLWSRQNTAVSTRGPTHPSLTAPG